MQGSLSNQEFEDKLMHSVIENDEDTVNQGKLISDVINQGFSSFTPDMMFDNLTKDYAMSKQIYGESMIRLITGYDPDYVKKNMNIPEFQRELNEQIKERVADLKDEGLINKQGDLTARAFQLASLIMYTQELDNLIAKGLLGEKEHKEHNREGMSQDTRRFRKQDSYRDIAIKPSVKQALRRGRKHIATDDLVVKERESKGSIDVIYGIDASGSMKGKKIEAAKKAGIALAYKAIEKKDRVGLLVFGEDVKEEVEPTLDFSRLIQHIAGISAFKETNITAALHSALHLFRRQDVTRHLLLLSDAMPTIGEKPEQEVLEAVSLLRNAGITVSLVGISLDEKGRNLGEQIAEIGGGKFYTINDTEQLDTIILEDYYSLL